MTIKSDIEMLCHALSEEMGQREFRRKELRYFLKDALEARHIREHVEREFNKMLQEGQSAIFVNKRGNVQVRSAPISLEKFFESAPVKRQRKLVITRIEIDL